MSETCCKASGPGYKSPKDAMRAEKEKLVYTVLSNCDEELKPDRLVTIDVDPASPHYSQIIHKLDMTHTGDELHHFGWNACSSCCDDPTKVRRYLIVPGFKTSRIYIIDTIEPRQPTIHKIIEPEEVVQKANLSAPHTVHCLANGNIMISMLGDGNRQGPGGFLLLNERFEVIGKWAEDECKKLTYNYDYWYQPYHNVMVSTEWAAPNTFTPGFNPDDVKAGKYGRRVNFWDWKEAKLVNTFDLGENGHIPLEVRFHHNPRSTHGFVGAALSSSVFHWSKPTIEDVQKGEQNNNWTIEKIIQVEPVTIDSWPMPVPSLITDILISMDDRFLYFSNWLHGDIRQYDITNPSKPKLVGQVWCGGLIGRETIHKGRKLAGGPQMIQLSLDGKRLYVTNSLFSSWDNQFYPNIAQKDGSYLLMVNCDTDKGGMTIDERFFVTFSDEHGRYRGHETRYPGGDCSSDIWIA